MKLLVLCLMACTCLGYSGNARSHHTSTLLQDSLPVELPFSLTFQGPVAGTLADANGQGTGFREVIPYSGTRLAVDGSPSNINMPAFEASRLSIANGRLNLLTNKGIDFLTNNNQLNVLVVKVDSERKLEIDLSLANPFYGTAAQQAGIWFGLNDKTFLKLVVSGNRFEMRREINDASSNISGTLNPDQRLTPIIGGLQNQLIRLRLVVDPVASTAEGFYSINGVDYVNVGAAYGQPMLSTAGMGLHASTAFAGIYATHRNGTSPVTYQFDDFNIRELTAELPVWDVKVNFQDPQTIPPMGWLRDYGQAFGARTGPYQGDTLTFGWKTRANGSPVNLSVGGTAGNGRNRGVPQDVLLATLMHMQGDDVNGNFNGNPVEGYWEMQVANGVYDVTVSAGDADLGTSPEIHSLNVEGVSAISGFQPSGAKGAITRFKSATVRVQVTDGHLTINADGGTNTKINSARIMRVSVPPEEERPYVIASSPADGATNVSLTTVSIAANHLHVPVVPGYPGGVDNATITSTSVFLTKSTGSGPVLVPGVPQGTGGGDAISFTPEEGLEPNTVYTFKITEQVKSYSGAAFLPFEATFTTQGTPPDTGDELDAVFTQVPIPQTQNKKYSSLTFGPDGKLYALRLDGTIERYTVNHNDGTFSNQEVISTLVNRYGIRSAVGLVFDPQSTPQNPVAWVSHSYGGLDLAPDFSGSISRLSGNALQNEQLVITHLPRSKKDHMTNSVAFGPDGALYICQGGNSSMGAYDPSWQRNESLLGATVLRLDLQKLATVTLPIDAQTTANQAVINAAPSSSMTMSDGTYNPYGTASPLTIFASGVRNAYDMVWHSNGQLYVPVNGSGGGGNTPASVAGTRRPNGSFYSGPVIPATVNVKVQNDWLLRINPEKGIGFFGHPNPLRGEFVANRGYIDNPLYPSNIQPDANYRSPAYDFGTNKSPNGAIEYKSDTFNGALKGKLLVCRFSGGGDIIVLEPGTLVPNPAAAQGNDGIFDIVDATTGSGDHGLVGMSGFANPLDIVEDTVNGNLYVIEFNWNNTPGLTSGITLLKVGDIPDTEVISKINFQESATATPSGYKGDTGLPYSASRGYGWVDPQTGLPKDHTASMRTRTGADSLQLRSFAHMQATTNGQSPGSWEFAADSGWYHVTVSAGDPGYFDSSHQINVEGIPAITGFVPTSGEKYRRATVLVLVEDGRLTLTASGGVNTKINYVIINPAEAPELSDARIAVQNQDLFPAADELVFSRIQIPWRRMNDNGTYTPYNANHDQVKLRISNEGTDPLAINGFSLSQPGRWNITPGTVPVTVAPGAFTEITITFTAVNVNNRVAVLHDTLYISSNDATMPVKKVLLHGIWQRAGEGTQEPYAQQVLNAFNFKTRTGYNSNDGAIDGETIVPNSDELIAPFFQRADPSRPVTVIQLAAYHGCCSAIETFRWYNKGSGSFQTLFTHNPLDGQSVLPRRQGSSTLLARGTFNPAGAFGIRIGSSFTDRDRNAGDKIGIRIWKAIDSEGNPIPNAYLMGGDYLGTDFTNYDYQDNIYYIENVHPEGTAPEPPPSETDPPVEEPDPADPPVEEPDPIETRQASITAYPNPNTGSEVRVRGEGFGPNEEVRIEVRDLLGRVVHSQTVTTGADGATDTRLEPNVNLNNGIYFIRAIGVSGNDDSILIVL